MALVSARFASRRVRTDTDRREDFPSLHVTGWQAYLARLETEQNRREQPATPTEPEAVQVLAVTVEAEPPARSKPQRKRKTSGDKDAAQGWSPLEDLYFRRGKL